MPNWGPVSVSNGPGAFTPEGRRVTLQTFGPFLPGEVTRVSGTAIVSFAGGRSDAFWDLQWDAYAPNGDLIETVKLAQFRLTTSEASFNRNVPLGATLVTVSFGSALYASQTQTCVGTGTYDAGTFCQFGTRKKTTAQFTVVLTAEFIITALTAPELLWLAPAFSVLAGIAIDITGLCGVGPPQVPQLNTSLLDATIDEKLTVFKRILWDQACECVPGAPTPQPYPPYQPSQPGGWPATPTFPCDPADLCASISQMKATLNALVGSVAATRTLVELLQRYGLPMAYIRGATHSDLTGDGSFAVSRLVGLDVDITTKPPNTRVVRGNPPYQWDMGWLSISDAGGMLDEKRLTRDSMLWLPHFMPTALTFSWDLFDGVVVRVTELEAEP